MDDPKARTRPAGQFERTPTDEALNAVHTYGDEVMELGWVYTVIAGVLNILVIYDAVAGPAFLPASPTPPESDGLTCPHPFCIQYLSGSPADPDRDRQRGLQRHALRPVGRDPQGGAAWAAPDRLPGGGGAVLWVMNRF